LETINHNQRKLIFALINDLAEFTGYVKSKGKSSAMLRQQLNKIYFDTYDQEISLKDGCPIEDYNLFKDMILEYAFELGCQFKQNPIGYYEDTERYLIMCIKHRVCCLTGKPNADIHHTVALGKGVNRDEVDHSKYPRMSLCREKHQEAHQHGQEYFDKKYHVHGVFCDYHNKDLENIIEDQMGESNIKRWKYKQTAETLGVRFKDGTLKYYRMNNAEHDAMMMAENSGEYFYKNVYRTFEEIELD